LHILKILAYRLILIAVNLARVLPLEQVRYIHPSEMAIDLGLSDTAGLLEEDFARRLAAILRRARSKQINNFFSTGASGLFIGGGVFGS
jgi:hypothetical protein